MTLQELKYLVALADHGHFGRAAEACFITQSTQPQARHAHADRP